MAFVDELKKLYRIRPAPIGPTLTTKSLLGSRADRTAPLTFPDAEIHYTFSGSTAVYQAAIVLGLSRGDRVLVPSYSCGGELEPLLRHGVAADFYRVDRGMNLDFTDLERRITGSTRAVLLTHYFGFPQPAARLRALCDRRGLFLIEDCAHALYSKDARGYLGACGDVSIFSLRKSLPLPNGGALVVHNSHLDNRPRLETPPQASTYSKALDLWRQSLNREHTSTLHRAISRALVTALVPLILSRRLLRRLPMWDSAAWFDPDHESFDFDGACLEWRMDRFANRILERSSEERIVALRRANYSRLLELVSPHPTIRAFFPVLPEGTCPLYFPATTPNPVEAVRRLWSRGYAAINWWMAFHPAVAWEDYPDATWLKNNVVALPIHQDISERQLRAMVELLVASGEESQPAALPNASLKSAG